MSKVDVSITRKDVINIGDYSNVSPSVTLTVKDVDLDKVQQVYNNLSELCFTMQIEEVVKSINEMESMGVLVRDTTLTYVKGIEDNVKFEDEKKQYLQAINDLVELEFQKCQHQD